MKKKALSFLLSLAMVLTLVPALGVEAWADEPSEYEYLVPTYAQENIATSGVISWSIETKAAVNVTVVSSSDERVDWNEGWYVVKDEAVTINNGVNLLGNVHLILTDGASLSIMDQENPGINVNSYSLVIYGQTKNTGNLNASSCNCSGIGGSNITINGGKIDANGCNSGAGIGGNDNGDGSNIIINGGIISAMGGDNGGAGIGGGANGVGSEITINGGSVQAYGCGSGAGIGGGVNGTASNITINGGTVFAQCNGGDTGIGKGSGCETPSSNIFVNENLIIKADATNCNPITEVAANRDNLTDISATLSGFKFVQIDPAVELISGFAIKYFKTVSKAAIEAKSGNTIKLFVNTTGNAIEVSGKAITLDLNGYVLSGEDNENKSVVTVCSDGELTITDSAVKTSHPHYFTYSPAGAWTWNHDVATGNTTIGAITPSTPDGTIIKVLGGCITGGNAGILNGLFGKTYLQGVTIVGNSRQSDAGGGIINVLSTLSAIDCNIIGNSANNTAYGCGGGVYNSTYAYAEISGCAIMFNFAGKSGCGVYNGANSKAIISNSAIMYNFAKDNGGGVYNAGTVTMNSVDVLNNVAKALGGGISNEAGILILTKVQLNNNTAKKMGGGLYNSGVFDENQGKTITCTAIVSCCEIKNNYSDNGGGIYNGINEVDGGDTIKIPGHISIYATDILNNTALTAAGICNGCGTVTLSGITTISGNAISGSGIEQNVYLPQSEYIAVSDLLEGSNIGITTEVAPTSAAPVKIASGSNLTSSDAACFVSDLYSAKYLVRATNGGLEIELYDVTVQQTYVCVNTSTSTSYSSIQAAVDAATTGQTIRLITNVAISAALNITNEKEFTLDLNGFVIKQTSQASVIQNQGKLTIEDNNSDKPTYYYTVSSSGIWVWEENVTDAIITSAHALGYYESTPSAISTGAVVAISGGAMTNGKGTEVSGNILGGCVYNINPGKLVLSDVSIVGNIASGSACNQGGGIFNEHSSTTELLDVNIVGNMVVSTVGDAYGGGIHNKSSVKCTGGSISFNISHASYFANGGGINNMGEFTMNESLVIGNKANGGYAIGGGINNSNNEMEITKCNVNNNTAISPFASYGGGICLQYGLLWLGSSNIHNNTVSAPLDCGGGIINLEGSITVSGIMSIKNNIASSSCNTNNMALILPMNIYDLDNNSDIGISLIDSSCATTTGAISTTGASFASAFFADNARQEVKASDGALYLQKKSITITAGSSSKTHDGTALTCDTYTSTGSLAAGDVLYVTVSGIQTEKGSSENIVSEVAIISASLEDVTGLYSITTVSGVLTVNEKSNPVPSAPTESKREVKINIILNGSVTSSVDAAYQGTKITLTVTANEGYELDTITAKDLLGQEVALTEVTKGKTYSFTMPASFVSVDAVFKKIEKEEPVKEPFVNPFVDIVEDAYYYDAVLWAAENGITSGMDATHFDPMRITTRAQMVTFLWRAAGSPEPEKASVFTDLEEGSYYEKAVAWGYENGYVKGISATEFAPNMTVTRAQTVTFLARLNGVLDESTGYNHDFLDVFKKDYYNNAVAWAKTEGITSGMGDNLFAPLNDCLRGQIVTFIYRNYVK